MKEFLRILALLAATVTIGVCQFTKNSSANERAAYWKTQGYNFDPSYMTASSMDRRVTDIQRAAYWKSQGYNFDPSYMTASSMDRKVTDIQRAAYWKTQGYNFDPSYMTASSMDRKVTDIQRAAYWKTQGYNFDPSYMTASSMDRKVPDIQRAAYWKSQGYNFDPSYMTASSMDRKVPDIQRAAYWKSQGYNFDPSYMTASSMDRKVTDIQRAGVTRQAAASTYTSTASSHTDQPTTKPTATASYRPNSVASTSAPAISYSYPVTPLPASKPAYVQPSTGTRYYDYNYRPAVGNHAVSSYVRRDGTYVEAHRKTNSDDSYWNNWSSRGNLNPYTGRIGTKMPSVSSGGGGYVSGYMKSNGTYVSGHFRKSR